MASHAVYDRVLMLWDIFKATTQSHGLHSRLTTSRYYICRWFNTFLNFMHWERFSRLEDKTGQSDWPRAIYAIIVPNRCAGIEIRTAQLWNRRQFPRKLLTGHPQNGDFCRSIRRFDVLFAKLLFCEDYILCRLVWASVWTILNQDFLGTCVNYMRVNR